MKSKFFSSVSCGVLASFVSSNLAFSESMTTPPHKKWDASRLSSTKNEWK